MFTKVAIAAAIAAMSAGAQAGSITFENVVAGVDVLGGVAITDTPSNAPNKNALNRGTTVDGWSIYTGKVSSTSSVPATADFINTGNGTDTYLFGKKSLSAVIANGCAGLAVCPSGTTNMPVGTTTASWQDVQANAGNWALGLGGSKSLNFKSSTGATTEFKSIYLFNTSTADKVAQVVITGYTHAGTASQAAIATQTFSLSDESGGTFNLTNFAGIAVDGLSISTTGGKYLVVDNVMAVPEPSTYAMLLAGLGMMGFIARRRTRA